MKYGMASNIHSAKVLKSDIPAILIPLFLLRDSSRQEVISLRQTNLYGSNFHMNYKIKEEALCVAVSKMAKNEHHVCQENVPS